MFPRKGGKTKQGDASEAEVKKAREGEGIVIGSVTGILPIKNVVAVEEIKIKDAKSTEDAYKSLRKARSDARFIGVRAKRAKAKEEEEASKKK